jgi:hypothetical protein
MKTLLLWLAGIGGLLIILSTANRILGYLMGVIEPDRYVKWSEMTEAAQLWKARKVT